MRTAVLALIGAVAATETAKQIKAAKTAADLAKCKTATDADKADCTFAICAETDAKQTKTDFLQCAAHTTKDAKCQHGADTDKASCEFTSTACGVSANLIGDKAWANCKLEFPATTAKTFPDAQCRWGLTDKKTDAEMTKQCTWAYCEAVKDTYESPNCQAKFPGVTYGSSTLGTTHLGTGLYGPESTDNQKLIDWAQCATQYTHAWSADSNCGKKFPGATTLAAGNCEYGNKDCTWDLCHPASGALTNTKCTTDCHATAADAQGVQCWNPTDDTDNCLYGANVDALKNCKADVCGVHEHADGATAVKAPTVTKTTTHADWDDYFYSIRCSNTDAQKYRLNYTNTRTNWAGVNKKDVNDLATKNGDTKALATTETTDCAKDKTTTVEKAACKKATAAVTANTADVAKLTAYLLQNQDFRVAHDDATWWTAKYNQAKGVDGTAAEGAALLKDSKARQTANTAAIASTKTAVTDAKLKACATTDKDHQLCLNQAWATTNKAHIDTQVTDATALTKANTFTLTDGKSTQPWYGYWNTNAIKNAATLADAKALQATNVSDAAAAALLLKTPATDKTAQKDKHTILALYETNGAAVLMDVKDVTALHAKSLTAATTAADVTAIKSVDTKAHTAAASAEKKACAKTKTTTPEKAVCVTDTKWTAMQASFLTADDARTSAIKAAAKSPKKVKTNAAQGKTKTEADAILAKEVKAETDAKNAVDATKKKQKAGDCTTTKKTEAACLTLAATLKTEEAALTAATTKVATQKAYITSAFPSGSGATIGIIIGSIAVVLCIGGGAAWYIKHKKANEFGDDLYAKFVDSEM